MPDRQAITVAMAIFMAVLSTTSVIFRFLARRGRKMGYGADDWTIVVALVFVLAMCADCLVGALIGKLGVHGQLWPQGFGTSSDPAEAQRQLIIRGQTIWVVQWLQAIACGVTKVSVLLLYKKIFLGSVFQTTNLIFMALSGLWTFSFFVANFLDCVPLKYNWTQSEAAEQSCVDIPSLFWAFTISDVILDAMILTLPWYPVSKLQLPLRRKLAVCGMFLTGGLVVAAGIVRLTAIDEAVNSTSPDRSYVQCGAFYWAAVEAGLGVVSACLPTLGPILNMHGSRSLLHSIRQKISNSYQSKSQLDDDGEPRLKQSISLKHNASKDSLGVYDGKTSDQRYQASAEFAYPMVHLEPPPAGYIATRSYISQEEDLV